MVATVTGNQTDPRAEIQQDKENEGNHRQGKKQIAAQFQRNGKMKQENQANADKRDRKQPGIHPPVRGGFVGGGVSLGPGLRCRMAGT